MNKMKEIIQNFKNKLNNLISKESSNEQIQFVSGLNNDLDDIQKTFNDLEKEHQETKNTLIEYVKRGGDTKTPPEDETQSKTLPDFETYLNNKLKEKEK